MCATAIPIIIIINKKLVVIMEKKIIKDLPKWISRFIWIDHSRGEVKRKEEENDGKYWFYYYPKSGKKLIWKEREK